jgi:hypothetical protein
MGMGSKSTLWFVICSLILMSSEAVAKENEREQVIHGPFVIDIQRWRLEQPIPHFPARGTNVSLSWHSSDQKLLVVLQDDGTRLNYSMSFADKVGDVGCSIPARSPNKIGPKPSNADFWKWSIENFTDNAASYCQLLTEQKIEKYAQELADSVTHYPSAADIWKNNILIAFDGRMSRCQKFEIPTGTSAILPVCTKWSKGWPK